MGFGKYVTIASCQYSNVSFYVPCRTGVEGHGTILEHLYVCIRRYDMVHSSVYKIERWLCYALRLLARKANSTR